MGYGQMKNQQTHRSYGGWLARPISAKVLGVVKKDDAREAIVAEWDRWAARNPDDAKVMNGMLFFVYLQEERPSLLDFRSNSDKWQAVHGWLVRARRLKD
jgi:hypothetical protein